MRLHLVSCEVLYREMCSVIARSPHQVDAVFLPKGLHDLGSAEMRRRIQAQIDAADEAVCDAILLGFGLCNNGVSGIRAAGVPLVIPRAHDCMTLFLGCRNRYLEYFHANPGVYFQTSGWIERGEIDGQLRPLSIPHRLGMDQSFQALVEKYGEDNAHYLYDTLCDTTKNYRQVTFIEMGIEPDDRFERTAQLDAESKGWRFEKIQGDMALIEGLVNGAWSEQHFLVVLPGEQVVASYADGIIRSIPAADPTPSDSC